MTVGTSSSGARVVLREPVEGEPPVEVDDDPWSDWGERLPLEETAGVVHRLVVEVDGVPGGVVSWHRTHYGPNAGSLAWNVGIALATSVRGRGVGSLAQRLLARHLFDTTPIDRVEASTDVTNVAERRALERAGFTFEGVLRGAQARTDGRHDLAAYAVLRTDPL
ncbi:MAG: GNAT family protein [Candidatus Nanopelagicales bacterium]